MSDEKIEKIMTIPELRKFVKKADVIFAMVRFGCSEEWLKITKKEALFLLDGFEDGDTPKDLEMFGDSFGSLETVISIAGTRLKTLYLG